MIDSFRLRLALLCALLTGVILAAFGLGTWWLVRDIKLERIDSEVRANAEREASRTRSAAEWQRIEARLVSSLGVRNGSELILLVQDGAGADIYRSPHWPATLDAARFPWPSSPPAKAAFNLFPVSESRAEDSPPDAQPVLAQAERGPEPGRPPADDRPPRGDRPPRDDSSRPASPPASDAISQRADGHLWRVGLARTDRSRVAVAVDAEIIDADMKGMRNAFLVALPFALVLIGLAGWIFSGRALRPLRKLTAAARRVNAEGLDQRIPGAGEDREFVELIEVFNRMLERLERSFKQAHRFSADAAHELKTPLAILQGQLERAIDKAEDGSPMQEELTGILDEVRRLSTISRKLLLLSQADAGRLSLYREPFDLSKALADLVEDTRMVAPRLQVSGDVPPGLIVPADSSLLRQVLYNLISNAIKYNVEGGWIRISATRTAQGFEVGFANSSAGITAAEQGKLFDRFYRGDPAHSHQTEGAGLGLSVSREIARAHGGDITLKESSGGVVQFSLALPASAPG